MKPLSGEIRGDELEMTYIDLIDQWSKKLLGISQDLNDA